MCGTFFHMLICYLQIFFAKVSFRSFGYFLKPCFLFLPYLWVSRIFCVPWITFLNQICLLQTFFPHLWLVVSFSWQCLLQKKTKQNKTFFNFNDVYLSIMDFMNHAFTVVSKKSSSCQGYLGFLLCYLLGVLYFTFKSVIHLH